MSSLRDAHFPVEVARAFWIEVSSRLRNHMHSLSEASVPDPKEKLPE